MLIGKKGYKLLFIADLILPYEEVQDPEMFDIGANVTSDRQEIQIMHPSLVHSFRNIVDRGCKCTLNITEPIPVKPPVFQHHKMEFGLSPDWLG